MRISLENRKRRRDDKKLRRKNYHLMEAFYKTEEAKNGEPFGWNNCIDCYLPSSECVGNHYDEDSEEAYFGVNR